MKEAEDAPQPPVTRRLFFLAVCLFGYVLLMGGWWLASHSGWKTPREPVAILVLPYANSPQLAPELAADLSKNPAIRIFNDTTVPANDQEIRNLGVKWKANAVLTGSVSSDNARYRVTSRLIDTASGYHVWEHTYDFGSNDPKQLATQITKGVVGALRGEH
jgi:TolB-like protein